MSASRPVAPNLLVAQADGDSLLANLAGFARLLRSAGLPSGPDKIAAGAQAMCVVGIHDRADVRDALAAVFVESAAHREPFRRAFDLYFSAPGQNDSEFLEPAERLVPARRGQDETEADDEGAAGADPSDLQAQAGLSATAAESLAHKDFERMSRSELAAAADLIANIKLAVKPVSSRRQRASASGRVSLRRTAREAFRTGGEAILMRHTERRSRPPAIVALCDISGSMAAYARMFALFAAVLARLPGRTHAFAFGTRLTRLDARGLSSDLNAAASAFGEQAPDWGGGTRIGACLREFNRIWARRLLACGGDVLLATDGLECSIDSPALEREVERLAKSCRRLIWLNPLLRYDGYEALAAGASIIARYADATASIHNVESLAALARMLGREPQLLQ